MPLTLKSLILNCAWPAPRTIREYENFLASHPVNRMFFFWSFYGISVLRISEDVRKKSNFDRKQKITRFLKRICGWPLRNPCGKTFWNKINFWNSPWFLKKFKNTPRGNLSVDLLNISEDIFWKKKNILNVFSLVKTHLLRSNQTIVATFIVPPTQARKKE